MLLTAQIILAALLLCCWCQCVMYAAAAGLLLINRVSTGYTYAGRSHLRFSQPHEAHT
jgi:hypothetical protein